MGVHKSRALHAKANQCDESISQLSEAEPYYKQILKRDHADDEEFDAKSFPFEELIPRWKGDEFDPHFINTGTGQTFAKQHHKKGEGLKKRTNFECFDFCFCLEWKYRTVNGVLLRDRCYNEFLLKSPGCSTHSKTTFKEGPNMVYHRLARGETCNWAMLKDTQALVSCDTRESWTYVEWREYAEGLAQEEFDLASEQGREGCELIMEARMAEFDAWWRIEAKKDAQQGGAKTRATRGYSLMGTRTVLPAFMARRPDSDDPPSAALSQLKLDGPADHLSSTGVANTRKRFGKDASQG
jgi:hypothetical protein